MKLLKMMLTSCLLLVFRYADAQQDAQFSQYIFNGLYINPAYAGYQEDIFVNSFYRSQWTGFTGAPQTVSLTADGAFYDNKVGLGVLFQQDKIGAQSSNAFYANYAYRTQLGEQDNSVLSFGLGFGFLQNSINGNELNAVQSGDNYVPAGSQSLLLPDARIGALYTNDNFFAGASADNMLASYIHKSSLSALTPVPKPHIYVTAGALFDLNEETKLKPSILFRDSPGSPQSLDINTFILLNDRIWLGGTYRTAVNVFNGNNTPQGLQKSSALVAMAEFFVKDNFRIGYAFDYSLNAIGNYGYGSHELSVSFLLKRNRSGNRIKNYYF